MVAIAFALVIGLPLVRTIAVLILSGLGLASAIKGLRVRGRRPQALASFVDLVIAPMIIGLATLSPAMTAASGFGVAGLMFLSSKVDLRAVLIGVVIGSVGMFSAFAIMGTETPSNVMVGVVTFAAAIVAVILTVGLVQWWQTRRSLARREAELAHLLSATPVMLVSVVRDGVIGTVAGQVPDDRWQTGEPIDSVMPQELVLGIRCALAGNTETADVTVGDRAIAVTCTPSAEGVTVTGFDITEREEARRSLEKLVASKDQFVASISHELRTPLTAVLGFAEELRGSDSLTDEDRVHIHFIADQSAEMAAIIEDLLVAARADLGIVTIVEQPVRIGDEASAVAVSLGPRLSRSVNVEADDAQALADPVRVRQIVRNLITNADRYGDGRIEVRSGAADDYVFLEVRDQGPALSDHQRELVFVPYETAGSKDGRPSAIGLGLSVSRTLAQLMGGSLDYHHDGGWSVFRLELPRAAVAAVIA